MDNSPNQKPTSNNHSFELIQNFERSEEIAQLMIDSARSGETVIGVD